MLKNKGLLIDLIGEVNRSQNNIKKNITKLANV